MSTKLALIGILASLQSIEDNYQIRSEGEIKFKEAKNAITELINAPEPAPVEIIKTEVATSTIAAAVSARLDEIASGLHEKLDGMISEATGTGNVVDAISDKIDGMEDVLAAIALADAPATEEAPA